MTGALAIRELAPPARPFGLQPSVTLLGHVLQQLESGHAADRELDALIYEAIGWDVQRPRLSFDSMDRPYRRRLGWRARSPLATTWDALPSPTGDVAAARSLVPWRWSYSSGVVDGHPRAWTRSWRVLRGAEGPRFFECSGLTEARAMTRAALFAQRSVAMEGA